VVSAVQNIMTLEVTTRVGELTIQVGATGDATVTLPAGDFKSGAYTRIDLVDGDTFNNLTPDMLDAAHAELRAFHQQAVKDAQGLIDKRIVLIDKAAAWLGQQVSELLKGRDTGGGTTGGQAGGGQASGGQAGSGKGG
jgi:hypothetical protein